jgi:alanine racemase
MNRPLTAHLSISNLHHNLDIIKAQAPQAQIIAMVKANAYGHGLIETATHLQSHVALLGVACLDEALILRNNGITTPILLIEGIFSATELTIAATHNCHVVFHNHSQLDWLKTTRLSGPIAAWLKINTGMNRLGFAPSEADAHYKTLKESGQTQGPVRLMSHMACADEGNHPLNHKQTEVFGHLTRTIQTDYSLCNSAALFTFPAHQYHYVRPGIALYGASPFTHTSAADLGLKPVMTLKSQIIATHIANPNNTLGYGATHTCHNDTPIGLIAAGYGDGYPRSLKPGAHVLINKVSCPIIGRVSMDMMAIDLTNCPTVCVGENVILWGYGLPVEDISAHTNRINYDLLTSIQERVRRHWH